MMSGTRGKSYDAVVACLPVVIGTDPLFNSQSQQLAKLAALTRNSRATSVA